MVDSRTVWNCIACVVLATLMTARPAGAQSTSSEPRPNIVFVYVDDLGYTDVNPYSARPDQYYETPNIMQLAGQGMTFTNAYANAANCAPSRAALMSGQGYPLQPIYTVNSGARGDAEDRKVIPVENETRLPLDKITIAEELTKAGYQTAFMGKWHLGAPPQAGPKQQGFDVNVGGTETGHPSWEGAYFRPNNNPEIDDAEKGEYMTDYLFRKAEEYIRQNQDEPFYLQLSPYSVHVPLQAPDSRILPFEEKDPVGGHNNSTYAAMIKSVDRGIGHILETLDELGLRRNTMVIFYSDNGGLGGYQSIGLDKNGITDHAPLKGGKGTFYEGGIRVPLVIRWPKVTRPGTTTDEPVLGSDFFPTLLDAANVGLPPNQPLNGISFVPVLQDASTTLEREALYWHFPGYLQAYGPGDWRTTPVSVVRAGPWKLMRFYENNRLELYNLETDLGETQNLAQKRPEKRKEMVGRLDAWLKRTDAPIPRRKED
ncbi:sulfatase [Salinibacter ruber]|uniref:sulfatase n=1 Tax=Salinibacter ruber TaxID=146919 RepID=UPI002169FA32